MSIREKVSNNYWGESWKNIKYWQKSEILFYEYFNLKKVNVQLMQKCNAGYDLLLNNNIRIDVKYAGGTERSRKGSRIVDKTELIFCLNQKKKFFEGKGQTCDYYIFTFLQEKEGKIFYTRFLIPYEAFGKLMDSKTIQRNKIPAWIKKYELTEDLMEELGIKKKPIKLTKKKAPALRVI